MTTRTTGRWRDAEEHLGRVDPVLHRLIAHVGPCTIGRKPNSFSSIAEAIVHQQLSLTASRTIFDRVKKLTHGRALTPDAIASVSDAQLRAAGLSRRKVVYLRDLAGHILDKRLRLRALANQRDADVAAALTAVKGIGPWSAEMYLIFVLNRPDVFSPGDVGLQRAIRRLYRDDVASPRMRKRIDTWRPYRSIACWYLWASLGESIEY